MGLVIDTSALIAVERRSSSVPADDWMATLGEEFKGPAVLPAIVLAELLVGVHLADTRRRAAARRAQLNALTLRIPVVEFDAAIAEVWAQLFATLRSQWALDSGKRFDCRGNRAAPGYGSPRGPRWRASLPQRRWPHG